MRRIVTYSVFESAESGLSQKQERFLDDAVFGTWYQDEESGEVEVDGKFSIGGQGMSNLMGIKFSRVGINFYAFGNQFRNMEGFPRSVWKNFDISRNQLRTLEGGPEEVGEDYICSSNRLVSLKGAPDMIGGDFLCDENSLTTLEGGPSQVEGDFDCSSNPLVDLKGAPTFIGDKLIAVNCDLSSLEGLPLTINGVLLFDGNPVSSDTLRRIAGLMLEEAKSYPAALEMLWLSDEIPDEDKEHLFRKEFRFIPESEYKMLAAKQRVRNIQNQF